MISPCPNIEGVPKHCTPFKLILKVGRVGNTLPSSQSGGNTSPVVDWVPVGSNIRMDAPGKVDLSSF